MKLRCAASCGSCDWLDYKKRCPMPADRDAAVPPGAMSDSFERALRDFGPLAPSVLSRDPWVMTFDNFLSPDEVAAVLKHGHDRYERSTASGGRKDDEFIPLTSEIRTSWTTWCDNATCTDDPTIKRIYERVADVTQVRDTSGPRAAARRRARALAPSLRSSTPSCLGARLSPSLTSCHLLPPAHPRAGAAGEL